MAPGKCIDKTLLQSDKLAPRTQLGRYPRAVANYHLRSVLDGLICEQVHRRRLIDGIRRSILLTMSQRMASQLLTKAKRADMPGITKCSYKLPSTVPKWESCIRTLPPKYATRQSTVAQVAQQRTHPKLHHL